MAFSLEPQPNAAVNRWPILLPAAYMGMIFFLSSVPGVETSGAGPLEDALLWLTPGIQNLLHVPLFALLAILMCFGLGGWSKSSKTILFLAFLAAVAFGIFDEWHQLNVPGRYGTFTDVTLNLVGAGLGVWMYSRWVSLPPQEPPTQRS